MQLELLKKTALILAIIVLSCVIIVYGKSFLIPVVFAALLASLLIPVANWLQKKGAGKALSILSSEFFLLLFFIAFIALVAWQISDLSRDASNIEKQFSQKYQEIQELVSEKFHIPKKQQDQLVKEQQSSSSQKVSGLVTGFMKGMGGFATDTILVLVYIFLFLYFKETLQRFIIRIAPEHQKENAADIISRSQKVTQKYLTGLALMIVSLWVMYTIGFSIAGVKSPVFFAVLCGILEIVPFVGNLIGTSLTILFSIMQGGDTNVIIGIVITYGVVQFFQTYILEPLVVGAEVNLNPLFTILALVAGEMLWGIPGMILAIPIMGVTKIVCDHIEPLKPFGELIGGKDKKESSVKKKGKWLLKKIKLLFKKQDA
jgi:predicted PurR-regulated permease PerM